MLKKADTYLNSIEEGVHHPNFWEAMRRVINEARINTIKECAKRAKSEMKNSLKTYRTSGSARVKYSEINKQSILDLIKEVK